MAEIDGKHMLACVECSGHFELCSTELASYHSSGIDPFRLFCGSCKQTIRTNIAVLPENVKSPFPGLSEAIPGLRIMNDFITEEEEAEIMQELDGGDEWTEEMSRRVKHFGFPFNYRTLMLDFGKVTQEFPSSCHRVCSKFSGEATSWAATESLRYFEERQCGIVGSPGGDIASAPGLIDLPLTQLTANEYFPGQGIAPHTDTTTCFGPLIFILTCNAGITMNFKKANKSSGSDPANAKLSLYLPRRSLLIMSAESRFEWTHSIASRKFDYVNSELIQRGRRVSLTFRQALIPGESPQKCLVSSEIERQHVFEVYDTIAVHWHHTRGKRKVHWHRVKEFLLSIPRGSLIADVGSGDGKYFGLNEGIFHLGCDRSLNLLQVSQCAENDTFCCDAVKLPLRSDCFDASICIALLHHLGSVDRRVAVIRELLRITRVGGSILLQAWALEQEDNSKRQFDKQDVFVPWRLQKQFQVDTTSNADTSGTTDEPIAQPKSGGKSKEKKKKNKKDAILSDAAARQQKIKPYRAVGDSIEESDEPLFPAEHNDGRAELITYERYCHMYRRGELENLCSVIPCCKIVDSGYDKSNWFVQIQKIEDPRIVIQESSDARKIDPLPVNFDDVSSDIRRPQSIIGIGVPQPMPVINLRTLL